MAFLGSDLIPPQAQSRCLSSVLVLYPHKPQHPPSLLWATLTSAWPRPKPGALPWSGRTGSLPFLLACPGAPQTQQVAGVLGVDPWARRKLALGQAGAGTALIWLWAHVPLTPGPSEHWTIVLGHKRVVLRCWG